MNVGRAGTRSAEANGFQIFVPSRSALELKIWKRLVAAAAVIADDYRSSRQTCSASHSPT